MFPYKVQLVQESKSTNHQQRRDCAIYFRQKAQENPDFTYNLIMSDEALFHLNGFVNKQNCRTWVTENPKTLHERQLHLIKCSIRKDHWLRISLKMKTVSQFPSIVLNIRTFLRSALENHTNCDSNKMEPQHIVQGINGSVKGYLSRTYIIGSPKRFGDV